MHVKSDNVLIFWCAATKTWIYILITLLLIFITWTLEIRGAENRVWRTQWRMGAQLSEGHDDPPWPPKKFLSCIWNLPQYTFALKCFREWICFDVQYLHLLLLNTWSKWMHTGRSVRCSKVQSNCIRSILLRGSPQTQSYVPSKFKGFVRLCNPQISAISLMTVVIC